jgi:hypothetical protein
MVLHRLVLLTGQAPMKTSSAAESKTGAEIINVVLLALARHVIFLQPLR